ncbi:MAG: hypothetical protein AAFR54_00345 [Planctomycetota bacterium]
MSLALLLVAVPAATLCTPSSDPGAKAEPGADAAPASERPPIQGSDWLTIPDEEFAARFADMAFGESLLDRERVAWMWFVRVNQLIEDPSGRGMSGTGKVPLWMAWPTDPDTFGSRKRFEFGAPPRTEMQPSAEKTDLEAGRIATAAPDASNEEVNRNKVSYDYLVDSGLTTQADVATFFETHDYVNMPIGSVELKASWLQVTEGSPAPTGALTFAFGNQVYWWRGLHVQAKMRLLDDPSTVFTNEDPSWFWATFEFNGNPGVRHVRETLITQRAPLPKAEIAALLDLGGMKGFGFESYAPNGTQIRFTVGGRGKTPVILGHTDMEDFAGLPNVAQPQYWTSFQASCHSCHATASYNPATDQFIPFSVPTGSLNLGYNIQSPTAPTVYLGQGFKPLDFMWPIVFQAK